MKINLLRKLAAFVVMACLFIVSSVANAYGPTQCAAERFGSNLGCTAQDVSITSIKAGAGSDSYCVGGEPFSVNLDITVKFANPNRYDIGIFIANDGNSPQLKIASGGAASCSVGILPTVPPFQNIDGDGCGDGSNSLSGDVSMSNVTLPCVAIAGSGGYLSVPFVVSWDQTAGRVCSSINDPVPGATSKCNAPLVADAVKIMVLPLLKITNNITSISPGDTTTYTVVITNTTGDTLRGAVFTDPAVTNLDVSNVICADDGVAVCPATSVAAMQSTTGITLPDMPAGSSLTFTITATLASTVPIPGTLINTVSVSFAGQTASKSDVDTIVAAPLNHIRLIHTGVGSVCSREAVIVKACADSSCNTLSPYAVTLTLGPGNWYSTASGGTASNTVTFTGSTTQYLEYTSAQSVTLTTTSISPTPSGLTQCYVGSTATCTMAFSASAFVFLEDIANKISGTDVAVAGRPHDYQVRLVKSDASNPPPAGCGVDTNYAGAKSLRAWYTADMSDPGGSAPKISTVSLPGAMPSSDNLSLAFVNGVATFNLDTSDVGKYFLNLTDPTRNATTGNSNTLTVRPFVLAVNNIKAAGVNNSNGENPGDAVFTKAGSFFSADVNAYLWTSTADTDGDGLVDSSATFSQASAGGKTVKFATSAGFSAQLNTPSVGGMLGAFGTSAGAGVTIPMTGGAASPADLYYSEVGSFKLVGSGTGGAAVINYLGTSGVNLVPVVFNAAGGQNNVIGRFIPHHFDTVVTQGCDVGGFTYSAQPFRMTVTAKNGLATPTTTLNYDGTASTSPNFAKAVTLSDANGTTVGALSNTTVAAALFAQGVAVTLNPPTTSSPIYTFTSRQTVPTIIKLRAIDTDNVSSATGTEGTANIRSGRARLSNAYGSELLDLPMSFRTEYWNGTGWMLNSADVCTGDATLGAANALSLTLSSGLTCVWDALPAPGLSNAGCATAVPVGRNFLEGATPSVGFTGNFNLWLKKPGSAGTVTVTPSVPAWLGPVPPALATFGIYKTPIIYMRENY